MWSVPGLVDPGPGKNVLAFFVYIIEQTQWDNWWIWKRSVSLIIVLINISFLVLKIVLWLYIRNCLFIREYTLKYVGVKAHSLCLHLTFTWLREKNNVVHTCVYISAYYIYYTVNSICNSKRKNKDSAFSQNTCCKWHLAFRQCIYSPIHHDHPLSLSLVPDHLSRIT